MFTFNFNEYVGVKLTQRGLEIHKQNYEKYDYPNKRPYTPPKVDEQGYTWMQAWMFFQDYGEYFQIGLESPCESNIKVKKGVLEVS